MKNMPMGPYPVEVSLCLDAKDWDRTMRRECPGEKIGAFPAADHEAQVRNFTDDNGAMWLVIVFAESLKNRPLWERASIVVHEATHIWQYIVEHIAEDCTNWEIEALHVQWVSKWLFEQLAAAGWMEA